MIKNILKIIAIFLIGIVGGIFADQILWPYFIERPLFYKYRLEQAPTYINEQKQVTIEENVALQDAIGEVKNSLVGVRAQTKAGKIIEGSGIIVTADGLILTLDTILPQGSVATIFLDSKKLTPKVLQRKNGLVLLKVDENNLKPVAFTDFDKIKLGERVFLSGIIFNKDQTNNIVNEGIVEIFDEKNIQTNISDKNVEGSPLFNIQGQLVGLNTINKDGKIVAISIKTIRDFLGF